MDILPPQAILLGMGLLLVLGFLTAFAKQASIVISDNRLAALAEEKENAKKLMKLLEDAPAATMEAMETVVYFTAAGFTVLSAIGFLQPLTNWLYAVGVAQGLTAWWLSALVLTLGTVFCYMIFWELLPKRLAAKYAEPTAIALSAYTRTVSAVGRVLLFVPKVIASMIARLFGVRPHDMEEEVTEEEIRMMVDMGLESGAIDSDEKEMIHNIFEMDDKPVEDIMTHRTEACVLWMEDSLEDWKKFIDKTNHTRYPVCDEEIDNVVGVVNSRDFYRFMLSGGQKSAVRSIFRKPYFVPDSMKADELFSRMQQKNTHIVVVLDEYGGFQGLVTQEDLLEEIVGELYSEYDEPEKDTDIQYLDENTWKIKGATLIEDVEEELGIEIPEGDYNTFAGFVLDAIGTLPEDGTTAETEIGALQIKVTQVQEHRIEETVVCLNRDTANESEEDAKKK